MIGNAEDSMLRLKPAGALAFVLIFGVSLSAQSPSEQRTPQTTQDSQPQTPCANASQPPCGPSGPPSGPPATIAPSGPPATTANRAPQHILGIIPNFRAVSADTQLPPLSVKSKF